MSAPVFKFEPRLGERAFDEEQRLKRERVEWERNPPAQAPPILPFAVRTELNALNAIFADQGKALACDDKQDAEFRCRFETLKQQVAAAMDSNDPLDGPDAELQQFQLDETRVKILQHRLAAFPVRRTQKVAVLSAKLERLKSILIELELMNSATPEQFANPGHCIEARVAWAIDAINGLLRNRQL